MSVSDERKRQIAAELGIAAWADELRGGNDAQVIEHAFALRDRVIDAMPRGSGFASPQMALRALERDRAARLARLFG
jgi:hypothetical protein